MTADERMSAWVRAKLEGQEVEAPPPATPPPRRVPANPAARAEEMVAYVRAKLAETAERGDPLWAGTPWGPEPEEQKPEAGQPEPLTNAQQWTWENDLTDTERELAIKGDPAVHQKWAALAAALDARVAAGEVEWTETASDEEDEATD